MESKEIKRYERTIEHLASSGLLEAAIKADMLIRKLNSQPITEQLEIQNIIKELFGTVGSNPTISMGFLCDFGCNIHVGNNFYAAYNCVMLDYAEIRIGDNCLIGPNVGLYITSHNLKPDKRHESGYAQPIWIGNNVWIGGNTCILGGVKIGDGVVIGAGSVVNKDVEPNTVVAGNPIRVIKRIEED